MANAKISTLTIPFSGTTLPSSLYLEPDSSNSKPSGNITVSGGVLALGGGTYSDTGYYTSVNSQVAYDLTSSAAFIKVTAGESGTGDGDTGFAVLASNFSDGYNYDITGGNLQVQSTLSDNPTVVFSVDYNATSMAWLKISESSGIITFATSPDSQTWTTRYTTPTESVGSWTAAASYIQFFYGSNSGDSKPVGTAQFQSFNIAQSGGGGGTGATVSPPSPPILGMYETGGAFPTPGPSAWASGATTNLSATYMAWGQDWSTYAGAFITQCNSNGLTPFVELEPWESGTNWDTTVLFSDITGGTWDLWLEDIGIFIAGTGKPCILTFAHEMNVSGQYPWSNGDTGSGPGGGALTSSEWIAGWTYVRNKINSTANGLALWMWACSAYTGGTTISPAAYWPSSALPDMVGVDGYPSSQYDGVGQTPSLGTFAGQLQPTVTIIRDLGWTGPIFLSETNLAQMANGPVVSGTQYPPGESITDFVADMHTAGIAGILEFEDASWNLPQMSGAQWTEYNDAVAANYGTPGGGSPPSGDSLWYPGSLSFTGNGTGNAGTIGVHFTTAAAGTLQGVALDSAAGQSLSGVPATIGLFNASTQALIHSESATWSGAAGSGWITATFTSPPALSAGTTYMAAVFLGSTSPWFAVNDAFTYPATAGPLEAPDGGWYNNTATTAIAYPSSQYAGYNYGLDIIVGAVAAASTAGLLMVGIV